MLNLFFGSVSSIITLILVLAVIMLIGYAFKNKNNIYKWGRLIALFIIVGTAISGLSATRDGYATTNAVFSMSSIQSNICSIIGGALFLIAFISVFFKNQNYKRKCFGILSVLFICQVLLVEISRIIIAM